MEEEKRITYKAGITRTPSDFLCGDGELAECINLTTDHEELKPVVDPELEIESIVDPGGTDVEQPVILYVHRYNDEVRYVGYRKTVSHGYTSYPMCWFLRGGVNRTKLVWQEDFQDQGSIYYNSKTRVSSTGKVLIISDVNSGLHYYQWKTTGYDLVSLPLPEVKFEACMRSGVPFTNSGSIDGMVDALDDLDYLPAAGRILKIKEAKQGDYNDLVVGIYSKNKKAIATEKAFCEPFFVRTALELYDGSYFYISNPVLLFPAVRMNSFGYIFEDNLRIETHSSRLLIQQLQDFSRK